MRTFDVFIFFFHAALWFQKKFVFMKLPCNGYITIRLQYHVNISDPKKIKKNYWYVITSIVAFSIFFLLLMVWKFTKEWCETKPLLLIIASFLWSRKNCVVQIILPKNSSCVARFVRIGWERGSHRALYFWEGPEILFFDSFDKH